MFKVYVLNSSGIVAKIFLPDQLFCNLRRRKVQNTKDKQQMLLHERHLQICFQLFKHTFPPNLELTQFNQLWFAGTHNSPKCWQDGSNWSYKSSSSLLLLQSIFTNQACCHCYILDLFSKKQKGLPIQSQYLPQNLSAESVTFVTQFDGALIFVM